MKLLRLKDELDDYHQRRADKHGWLYLNTARLRLPALFEARSIATGVVCTLESDFVEEVGDAPKLP
jgi:hypothetical protein